MTKPLAIDYSMEAKEVLGMFLEYMRERLEFSQKELGEKVGKDQSDISKYERGKVTPNLKTMNDLTDILTEDFQSQVEVWALNFLWMKSRGR